MAAASIEVSGPDAERLARELQAALAAAAGTGESASAVEVQRSPELVIAVIGLVFSGVSTAKTIWDWWRVRHAQGATVKILLADGTRMDLAGIDQQRLEVEFSQRTSEG
ncbi:hypothetical protein [Pseudonocardia charpentierae]|uniref:Uncharacterized protein n=1 Tax=Pseudonocardia charpentierae TaxID=3075545 RepID=A0ABU2N4A5_9PSEU|nr:hypothetical protein [Pseudonocardia sp. DSM 45834]MDT0348149.1 hypothetical protein [Pseudonocardia sp. DSM 45834]